MAIKKENKWVFIVNPIAGDGRAIKVAEELELKLKEKEIDADLVYTISKGGIVTKNPYYVHPDIWLAENAPEYLEN